MKLETINEQKKKINWKSKLKRWIYLKAVSIFFSFRTWTQDKFLEFIVINYCQKKNEEYENGEILRKHVENLEKISN